MSKRAFTEEEKELLSNNKFVKHVGDRGITYTKDYKIYFLEEKKKGKSAEEIFESAGFDTELLGVKRITSFDSRITRDGVEDRRVGNSGRPRLTKEQIEEAISDPDKYDSIEGVRFTSEPDFNGLASLDFPGPYTSMGMIDTNVPIVKPNRITGEGRMKCIKKED